MKNKEVMTMTRDERVIKVKLLIEQINMELNDLIKLYNDNSNAIKVLRKAFKDFKSDF